MPRSIGAVGGDVYPSVPPSDQQPTSHFCALFLLFKLILYNSELDVYVHLAAFLKALYFLEWKWITLDNYRFLPVDGIASLSLMNVFFLRVSCSGNGIQL